MVEFDFYKRLASRVYNKPEKEITKEERHDAKWGFLRTLCEGVDENTEMVSRIIPEILANKNKGAAYDPNK